MRVSPIAPPSIPLPRSRARRVAAALLAALLLAAVGCGSGTDGTASTSTSTSTSSTTAPTTTSTAAPTTTSTTAPPPAATPTTAAPVAGGLRLGDEGPEVVALQERLSSLGYWLGAADGTFGDATLHAVTALQKAAGLTRDGVVGPSTDGALDAGVRPAAASVEGHVVEIDLDRQLLLIVDAGAVTAIFDTSTGRVAGTTPRGHWAITREIDGFRRSPLGLLYRPKYFYSGVAIHGYTSVPSRPASHGCVRVTYSAIDHIWAAGLMPVGTPVWVR